MHGGQLICQDALPRLRGELNRVGAASAGVSNDARVWAFFECRPLNLPDGEECERPTEDARDLPDRNESPLSINGKTWRDPSRMVREEFEQRRERAVVRHDPVAVIFEEHSETIVDGQPQGIGQRRGPQALIERLTDIRDGSCLTHHDLRPPPSVPVIAAATGIMAEQRSPCNICKSSEVAGQGASAAAYASILFNVPRTDEVTAGSRQDAAQLTIERRWHSRRGHHRHRLHALRDHVHLDLIAGGGEAILRRDLGSDFEHARDKLLKGRRLGGQRQLVIGAPPHPGLTVPLRPDLETPSLLQARHPALFQVLPLASLYSGEYRLNRTIEGATPAAGAPASA
jgi:hypothetical protein